MFFDHGEKWVGGKKFGKMTIVCNSTQLVVELEPLECCTDLRCFGSPQKP